jgi:hypothetical protein
MKTNYTKNIMSSLIFFLGLISYSQDIHFTLANAQNTNDGSNDYYEVDVMLQTINATGTFKLGSGQLYFTYSTTAFGENVFAATSFTVTHPNPDYLAGQFIDAAATDIYGPFTTNDNTASRVSWAFSQSFSSATFAADNVTATATKLCHLKFKYIDINQTPMVLLEEGGIYDDQFYTSCGSATGTAFTAADCGANPGTQIVNDTFASAGATLSTANYALIKELTVYPNPATHTIYINSGAKLTKVELYNNIGQQVLSTPETLEVKINHLEKGLYLLKLYSENATTTKKVIIE